MAHRWPGLLQRHQDIEQGIHVPDDLALRQWSEQLEQAFLQALTGDIAQHQVIMATLDKAVQDTRDQWMLQACEWLAGLLVVEQFARAPGHGQIDAFPALEDHTLVVLLSIQSQGGQDVRAFVIFENMFDHIAALTYTHAFDRAVRDQQWRRGQATADRAAALAKANWRIAEGAEPSIVGTAAVATALRARAVLVPAILADIALLGCAYRAIIAGGEFNDRTIALLIALRQRALEGRADFSRDAWIPLLWRGRRLLE